MAVVQEPQDDQLVSIVQLNDWRRKAQELRGRVKIEWQVITPQNAKDWLKKNIGNRREKKGEQARLVREIKGGRWSPELWDAIAFDRKGRLLNGQNRLMAIAEANLPVVALVLLGLDESAKECGDNGISRKPRDLHHMLGRKNEGLVASISTLALKWKAKELDKNRYGGFSNAEHRDIVVEYPDIQDAANFVAANKELGQLGRKATIGFMRWITKRKHSEESDAFFAGLASGANLEAKSPVLALRNKLLADKYDKYTKMTRLVALAIIIKAWNFHMAGTLCKRLIFRPDENFPQKIA